MEICNYIIGECGYDIDFNEEYAKNWKNLLAYPDENVHTNLIIRSYCSKDSPNVRRYTPQYFAWFYTPDGTKIGATITTTDTYRTSRAAYDAFIRKYPWIFGLD